MVKVGQKYRHFKGHVSTILNIAIHSETLEKLVIYEHDDTVWARPLSMFLDKEDVSARSDNITGQKYRFELIEEE